MSPDAKPSGSAAFGFRACQLESVGHFTLHFPIQHLVRPILCPHGGAERLLALQSIHAINLDPQEPPGLAQMWLTAK